MAANIATFEDGRKRMAGMGRLPIWWETQNEKAQRSDGEYLTIDEAYEKGGVDVPIETCPALHRDPRNGEIRPGKGVQIVRGDTGQSIGYASDEYKLIQNREVFDLFRPHLERGALKGIMSCGVLGDGEKAWMQGVLGEISVSSVDKATTTLLMTTDHTARGAARIGFNSVWVVCANTERAAQMEWEATGNLMKVTHQGDTKLGLKVVEQAIDLSAKKFNDWQSIARKLVLVTLTKNVTETKRLAIAAMMPPTDTLKAWQENADKPRGHWKSLYEGVMEEYFNGPGMDLDTRRDTAWGAVNAITGYVDYGRSQNQTPERRLNQAWFGEGNEIKNRAIKLAADHFLGGKPWDADVLEAERLLAV